jgi:hypothetical protein
VTDQQLIEAAIQAAGLTARRFAALVETDERKIRRNLEGTAPLSGALRVICRAIIRRPELAAELAEVQDSAPPP